MDPNRTYRRVFIKRIDSLYKRLFWGTLFTGLVSVAFFLSVPVGVTAATVCSLPQGTTETEAIIDNCAASAGGGYRRPQDFSYAYVLKEISNGDYIVCQDNQLIAEQVCSGGTFAWQGNYICNASNVSQCVATFADLTAGSVTPTTATAGSPTTLNATASNIGTADSGSFPVLYQVQETGALFNSAYLASIAPGGSAASSASYTFPSTGTYTVRACANNNTSWVNIVTESNYANNCGAWTSIVVAAAAVANLTAGSVTPTTATAGTPVTLNATASNIGTAASGSFPMLYQVQETGALFNSAYLASIPAGGSGPSSASYTFPGAGTYTVRACANNNTSWVNIVTESNYADNCGTWTAVTVAAAVVPVPSCTFTANPTATVPSTLSWSCTNVTSCTGGGFSTGFASPISGSASVSTAGAYTLSCTGSNGPVTSSVTVGSSCSGTRTGTVAASPNRIRATVSTPVTFTLSAIQNVQTSCVLSGPQVSQTFSSNSCTVAGTTYTQNLTLTTQGVYTLTCDGVKVNSTIVNVIPNFTEF